MCLKTQFNTVVQLACLEPGIWLGCTTCTIPLPRITVLATCHILACGRMARFLEDPIGKIDHFQTSFFFPSEKNIRFKNDLFFLRHPSEKRAILPQARIRQVASIIIRGKALPRYGTGFCKSREKFGPTLAISRGKALPHYH